MIEVRQIIAESIPLDLLLEADPSESKIKQYLSDAVCFGAFMQEQLSGACVVKLSKVGLYEIVNIAVYPRQQKLGIGSKLLAAFAIDQLARLGAQKIVLVLGTGTFGPQLAFYQRFSFRVELVIKDFLTRHYHELIFENGIQHKDMLRLGLNLHDL